MKAPKFFGLATLFATASLVAIITNYSAKASLAQMIEPPPEQPAPQSTTSGGSRPIARTCLKYPKQSAPFTAIASLRSVGLTPHEHPSVWVYVPPTDAKMLEFSLFDQNRQGIYQISIAIENQTGFIPISLPSSAPALNQNQPYYWTVALVCDAEQRTDDWNTGGWIQQRSIDSVLQDQLKQATLTQQIRLAAKAGYWYEAVDTYLRAQQAHPNDPQLCTLWADLLATGNLKSFLPKVTLKQKRDRLNDDRSI